MLKNKKIMAGLLLGLGIIAQLAFFNVVLAADGIDQAMGGLNTAGGGAGLDNGGGSTASQGVSMKIGSIIGSVLAFTGVIFLGLMVYAGLLWMTAAGSKDGIKKARELLMAAVIGLLIVMSAYAITAYVADNLAK